VKPIAGKIKVLRSVGIIKDGQNFLYRIDQISPDTAAVVPFIEPFQAAMFEAPNHQDSTVKCTLSVVNLFEMKPVTEKGCFGGAALRQVYSALCCIVRWVARRAQGTAAAKASGPSIITDIARQSSPWPRMTTADTATEVRP
jgi:hypothetical protein